MNKIFALHSKNKNIYKELFALTFIAIVCAATIGNYTIYASIALVLIILSYTFGEKFIISLIIISLFTLVGDINSQLRLVVHLIDFCLLGILFLLRFGLQLKSYPRIPKMVLFFIFLYYFSMITSSLLSSYPLAGVGAIFRQSIFFIIAYIFYALIQDESDIKTYFIAIIIATCVLAASTIVIFVMEGSSFIELELGVRSRVAGLITNPNKLTNFYMICFPLILFALLFKNSTISKVISWVLLLLFSAGLLLTISRTAIFAILISSLTILFICRRKYFYASIIILLSLLLILVVYEPFGNIATLLFRLERGLTGREHMWAISMDIIKENPVFGIGVGTFKAEMFNYFPVMINSWVGRELVNLHTITGTGTNLSHNFFLGFFTDMGIFGFLTTLTLISVYFRIGIKTLSIYKERNKETYYLIIALFLGGATMFIRGLVDNVGILSYGVISSDLPWWLILASLTYFYNQPFVSSDEKQ